MDASSGAERFETVIIGGGQAGLAMGYHLRRRGQQFVILEASQRTGDSWRKRWDSLRLFTPARHDGLPGWPFPAPSWSFPTRDEMADYLEAYAARFDLPVRTGMHVDGVSRQDGWYVVTAGDRRFEADHVVVASGAYQTPRVPDFAAELDLEAASDGHPTWMSGRHPGNIPFRIQSLPSRLVLERLVLRVLFHRVLTTRTPLGRKVRPKVIARGGPLIRVKPSDLDAARIERVAKVAGVEDGLPVLEDGRALEVENVVWCTGFQHDFSWIDLPTVGEHEPVHQRGIVPSEPGLYFIGLHFLYSMSSAMIHGVGRDAEHIAKHIAARAYRAQPRVRRAGQLAGAPRRCARRRGGALALLAVGG